MDDSKTRAFARRRMLQGAGGLIAAATLSTAPLTAAQSAKGYLTAGLAVGIVAAVGAAVVLLLTIA